MLIQENHHLFHCHSDFSCIFSCSNGCYLTTNNGDIGMSGCQLPVTQMHLAKAVRMNVVNAIGNRSDMHCDMYHSNQNQT